jgi:hypothetical protein
VSAARALAGVAFAATLAMPAAAQGVVLPTAQPELRADLIAHRDQTVLQVGGGVEIPAGYYVRVGVLGAVGPRVISGSSLRDGLPAMGGRVDVLARFLLDPFRQTRWGLSAGGGLSLRADPGGPVRPQLLVAVDLEGRRSARGVSPAFQVGLGGGLRVGGVLRWGTTRTR